MSNSSATAASVKGERIPHEQVVDTPLGKVTVTRTGTLTGETGPRGIRRVEWDEDGFGRIGWIEAA